MVKRLSTLLALVAGLLLPAAGGHAAEGDWVYLRKGADGNFEERTVPLLPNTFLSVGGNGTLLTQSAGNFTAALGLSTVAATGNYNDLTGKPALFSGSYSDLTGKPALFSGSYNDLADKPALFSGNYSDLAGKPDLGTMATRNATEFLALGASQPAWALTAFSGNATIASNQSGIGWDESGRFNIQTPVGAFQIYNTGNPSVPTLYWPGKIVSQSFDAIYVNGVVYASQIVGGQAGGNIAPSVMVSSMPEVLSNWIGLQSSAEQAGIPYDVDPDSRTAPEVPTYEPRAGDWFPIARTSVQAGGTNSLEGKYLSPAQARESLGITLFSGNYSDLSNKPTLFFAIQAGCSSFNPVQGNATTGIGSNYTFSQVFDLAPAAQRRMGFPIPLKLAAATLTVTVGGTLAVGASGPATLHLVNHTTGASTQILGGIVFTSQNWIGKSTGLSVALNATDDYSLRLDTPYFATPPTAVRLQATLYLMP